MPSFARREIVDQDQVGIYHCVAHWVRRAFLCRVADRLLARAHQAGRRWFHGVTVC